MPGTVHAMTAFRAVSFHETAHQFRFVCRMSIDDEEDILGLTVFLGCHSKVGHGSVLLLVVYDGVLIVCEFGLIIIEKLFDIGASSIGAGIINEYDVVDRRISRRPTWTQLIRVRHMWSKSCWRDAAGFTAWRHPCALL